MCQLYLKKKKRRNQATFSRNHLSASLKTIATQKHRDPNKNINLRSNWQPKHWLGTSDPGNLWTDPRTQEAADSCATLTELAHTHPQGTGGRHMVFGEKACRGCAHVHTH